MKRKKFNEDYFEVIDTPEKAYFLGWAGMSDIEQIYNGFYSDTDLFLIRKKIIFDEVIGIIREKYKYRKK